MKHKEAGYLTYRGKKSSPGGLIASCAVIITNGPHRFKSFMRCFMRRQHRPVGVGVVACSILLWWVWYQRAIIVRVHQRGLPLVLRPQPACQLGDGIGSVAQLLSQIQVPAAVTLAYNCRQLYTTPHKSANA